MQICVSGNTKSGELAVIYIYVSGTTKSEELAVM
jgi:hypothetical protein